MAGTTLLVVAVSLLRDRVPHRLEKESPGSDNRLSTPVAPAISEPSGRTESRPSPVEDVAEGITGRVVSSVGPPTIRFQVEIRDHARRLEATWTDAHGHFSFPSLSQRATSVRLLPQAGWSCSVDVVSLVERSQDHVEFLVSPLAPRRLSGRVIDESTLDALPGFTFSLRQDSTVERLTSDAKGAFRTTKAFTTGLLTASIEDWPSDPERPVDSIGWLLGPTEDRTELAVDVGPSYELLLAPLPDDPCLAALVPRGTEIESVQTSRFVPVREDRHRRWARFPPLRRPESDIAATAGWKVIVASRDRRVIGEADVDCTRGQCPQPVPIQMRTAAEVLLVVRGPDGPAPGIDILLRGPGVERIGRSSASGSYRCALPQGGYECALLLDGPLDWRAFEARGPGITAVDLFVPEVAHLLEGVLRSQSGTYSTPTDVLIFRPEGGRLRTVQVLWGEQDDGTFLGTFRGAVPPGRYLVGVKSRSTRYPPFDLDSGSLAVAPPLEEFVRWAPTSVEVQTPLSGIGFTCFDLEERRDLGFLALDASTGGEIPSFDVFYLSTTSGWNSTSGPHGSERVVFHDMSASRPLRWALLARGFRHAVGSEADFLRRSGDLLLADVELERGLSTLLFVTDSRGVPVRDAEILLGGSPCSRTDLHGSTFVTHSGPPVGGEVRKKGFSPLIIPPDHWAPGSLRVRLLASGAQAAAVVPRTE